MHRLLLACSRNQFKSGLSQKKNQRPRAENYNCIIADIQAEVTWQVPGDKAVFSINGAVTAGCLHEQHNSTDSQDWAMWRHFDVF